MAGYYINPYTALIGQAGQQGITAPATINGVSTAVICDDFAATISTSTPSWLANQMTLGALLAADSGGGMGSSAVKFDQNSATNQAFDYVAGAWLANNIFAAQQASNTTAQGEYTYALWELFDPGVPINYLNGAAFNGGGAAAATQASAYLNQAKIFANSVSGNYLGLLDPTTYLNMEIYTPSAAGIQELDAFQVAAGASVPIPAPEPSAPALFAFYLSSLVGLIVLFRRRVVRAAN